MSEDGRTTWALEDPPLGDGGGGGAVRTTDTRRCGNNGEEGTTTVVVRVAEAPDGPSTSLRLCCRGDRPRSGCTWGSVAETHRLPIRCDCTGFKAAAEVAAPAVGPKLGEAEEEEEGDEKTTSAAAPITRCGCCSD